MRLNISAWAIRKPIPSLVLFLVLVVLGLVSFRALPITRFPNIDIPIVSVQVLQSGAAPSELQTQVTKVVEDAVAGVKGVKHVISTISEGVSSTTIEFRLEVNSDRAVNDVKDAISKVRVNLPRTIEEPIINRVEIAGLPIMIYGASAPAMTPEDLSWLIDDVIARQVQSVKGVGGVERLGGVAREVRVTLKPDRLLALGHHGRRREPAAAPHRRRHGGRARRARRPGAIHPDPGGGGEPRHPGGDLDRRAGRPQGPPRRARRRWSTARRSRAPSRASTANPWWPSRSRAPPAPATRRSRSASPSASPNSAPVIRACAST